MCKLFITNIVVAVQGKLSFGNGKFILFSILLLIVFLPGVTSCLRSDKAEIVRLNELSYQFRYKNLDSTKFYATKAYRLAKHDASGRAEALNNLAFVSMARMDYAKAEKYLNEVSNITDNQVELLVSDIQFMRLRQRQSRNKDYYDYRERAKIRIRRIDEEQGGLDEHLKKRMVYARSEFNIVNSAYLYYVGLTALSIKAMEAIDPNGEILKDTAQVLNYYYNVGAGGIITKGTVEEVSQTEFDYLLRCYLLARQYHYTYWEANSMQALSEHLNNPETRDMLIRENLPAMKFLNAYNMPDSLLAGNLALRSMEMFSKYGDVYQTAGSYRTLAECYWQFKDYKSAIQCLQQALLKDTAINKVPDMVASIREQLSLAFSAIDDKPNSDYNRNIYLDMQEKTRQDRELEARAAQLDKSSHQLNVMIVAVIMMIAILILLLYLFSYMRKKNNERFSTESMLEPLETWKQRYTNHCAEIAEQFEELKERQVIENLHVLNNKKRNLEQRAKIALVNSITPLIDRIINEITHLANKQEPSEVRGERYAYIAELTDKINEYNNILTQWIQLRQGELSLHIESFPLVELFKIMARGKMGFQLKGIDLVVEPTTAVVKADRTLTLFMINTLADNARKFTPKGGIVKIYSTITEEYVEISVCDSGMGMTEKQLEHLFDHKPIIDETGKMSSAMGTSQRSHGFGLMNCKGIIDKYKKVSKIFSVCMIGAESAEGKGSRLYFRLPKGIARTFAIIAICVATFALSAVPSVAMATTQQEKGRIDNGQQLKTYMALAGTFADSAYFSNINGTYSKTLSFSDSCIYYLNKCYKCYYPQGKAVMVGYSITNDTPAELQWFHDSLRINYNIILDMRNECAVAALALHFWDVYHYNNKVYTKLFREKSADNTLGNYVRVLQKSETNKNVSIIILIILLLLIIPAFYLLYYRHKLYYRFCIERIKRINDILLSDISPVNKLHEINELWDNRSEKLLAQSDSLNKIVQQIRQTLKDGIDADNKHNEDLELAHDALRRTTYDNDKLHISNNVLDNCLSTLKHETMYYPSRIRQLIDGTDDHLHAINELACYYKELYSLLSAQASRQIEGHALLDRDMMYYLMELLQKLNMGIKPALKVVEKRAPYIQVSAHMSNVHLTDSQASALFTLETIDMRYLLCRQIVREFGEATNARGCGIQCHLDSNNNAIIDIIITQKIWNTSK